VSYEVSDKQFEAVIALSAPRRYEHFIKRIADSEAVWSLRSREGWVMSGDGQGGELMPVWPHPRYAAACATDAWSGTEPAAIPLHDFRAKWLPGLERDGRRLAVFPVPQGYSIPAAPERMRADLEEELAWYGEDGESGAAHE
jgi:hypothetical protein